MNYLRIYQCLIYKRQRIETLSKSSSTIGSIELHHIIPRSCGGSNATSNVINLTVREHFVAHWLLTKIYRNTQFEESMDRAFLLMSNRKHVFGIRQTSRSYALAKQRVAKHMHDNNPLCNESSRIKLSNAKKGSIPWNKGKTGCMPTPWNKGKHHSIETKNKLSQANVERFRDQTERDKIRKSRLGKTLPESTKQKMSNSRFGMRYINNGKINKKVKLIDGIDIPEPYKSQGFVIGYLYKASDETKQKISNAFKGKKKSASHREHIRQSRLGSKNPMSKENILKRQLKKI